MRFTETIEHQNHLAIGWVKGAHHLRGELFIQLFNEEAQWGEGITALHFSNPDGSLETKSLLKIRAHKKGFIVLLEGLKDRTEAETYKGRQVNLAKQEMIAEEGEYYLFQLIGYTLRDSMAQVFGRVQSFKNNGRQDLLVIVGDNQKTFDMPFVDELILEIDHDSRTLTMDVPPGIDEL